MNLSSDFLEKTLEVLEAEWRLGQAEVEWSPVPEDWLVEGRIPNGRWIAPAERVAGLECNCLLASSWRNVDRRSSRDKCLQVDMLILTEIEGQRSGRSVGKKKKKRQAGSIFCLTFKFDCTICLPLTVLTSDVSSTSEGESHDAGKPLL